MQPHCTPPGERTLFSLLCAAMQPLGTTLYVYGGGWNLDDTGAGREAVTPFPSPAWKTFFLSQDEGYDYRRFRGSGCNPWHSAGLDCSGYLGWVIYAALHRKSGLEGYVYPSTEMAGALAARGLGRLVRPPYRFLPGDLFSMEGHVWLCVGVCRDESLVIAHSSPTPSRRTGCPGGGVQLSAIPACDSRPRCEALGLARRYMSQFPVWSRRYEAVSRPRTLYTVPGTNSNSGLFRWSALRDPEGIRSMTAGQVPPIQRLAAGGENDPSGPVVIRHDMAWECRRPAAGVKGAGTPRFPCPS